MTTRTRKWTAWTMAALVAGVACEDPTGVGEGATLDIREETRVLDPGQTITLAFEAATADGGALDAGDVTWISTDPTTARVEGGRVQGIAAGVVHVIGTVGGARDSVRVRVRVADLGAGEVAARIAGSAPATERFTGRAFFSETMSGDGPSSTGIMPVSGSLDPREGFQAEIVVPGRIEAGERTLAVFDVRQVGSFITRTGVEGIAMYRLRTLEPPSWEYWVAVGEPRLEIESIDWPVGPGLDMGSVRGNASFEAAGLVVEGIGPDARIVGQVADSTSAFYIEFETPLQHFVSGSGTLEPGGRLESPPSATSGYALLRGGGLGASFSLVTQPPEPGGVQYVGSLTTWMPGPAPGDIDVPASGAEVLPPNVPPTTHPWMALRFRSLQNLVAGPQEDALSREGVVTITAYEAPTGPLVGRVSGTFEVLLAVWADGVETGETVPLAGTFTMPVYPEGWPSGFAAASLTEPIRAPRRR